MFQTGEDSDKHTEMLEAVQEIKLSVMCTSLNGLKDSEKNVRTLMMVKECMATGFVTNHELGAKDHQMTLILKVDQLHIKQETFHHSS